jgi:hypothetical protein
MGLGAVHTVTAEKARERAAGYRLDLLEGRDPRVMRDGVRLDVQIKARLVKTVREVAQEYFDQKIAHKSLSYRKNTLRLLSRVGVSNPLVAYVTTNVNSAIGDMPIQKVDRLTIRDKIGLREFLKTNNEDARVFAWHLERIFKLAIDYKYYRGENPAKRSALHLSFTKKKPKHHLR